MATESPFVDQEYTDRYARAQALMQRDGLDALIVSEKNNYWYFSGLISYQLDHIQRPQICILPKSGKPLGWARLEGKSRVVYLQLGHGPQAFSDPSYRQLLARSIRWLSRICGIQSRMP